MMREARFDRHERSRQSEKRGQVSKRRGKGEQRKRELVFLCTSL